MNIGVFIGSNTHAGGMLSHDIAVVNNLKLYGSDCGHKFFVYHNGQILDKKTLECNHLKLVWVKKSIFIIRAINYIFKKKFGVPLFISNPLQIEVDRDKIDLMYYTAPYGECLEIDIPYIFTALDIQHRVTPEWPEVSANGLWRVREQFFHEALNKAYAVIADGEIGKKEIIQFFNTSEERIYDLRCVPPKTKETTLSDIQMRLEYNITHNFVFYPAQFWPHKNHIGILHALHNIKTKYDIEIHAIFTGSDKGNLNFVKHVATELGLTKQVHFVGFVPYEHIAWLYRNAIALVVPTYHGPAVLLVYEAFQYRCPVIASDIPGIREQVEDAGILVKPDDFEALSEAIYRLHNNYFLKTELIEKGLKNLETSMSGEKYIKTIIGIIDGFKSKRMCWGEKYKG